MQEDLATPRLKVLFMGTPEFAVPSLQALLGEPAIEVVGVITQPDRRAGRGMKRVAPPVKELALSHDLPIMQPSKLRNNPEAFEFLGKCAPDLAVVVAFGQILPREVFEFPPFETINVHGSLLPRYRGAAPVAYAILNGDTETGITIMKIEESLDTGDMLSRRTVPISENMTGGELWTELATVGAELLLETIPGYVSGEIKPEAQDEAQVSYAPRIKKEQGRIDWSRSALEIHNQIRAFNPRPGSFTELRGQFTKVWRSRLVRSGSRTGGQPDSQTAGLIEVRNGQILVLCGGNSSVEILELQLSGKKRACARDFINGTGLKTGEAFL